MRVKNKSFSHHSVRENHVPVSQVDESGVAADEIDGKQLALRRVTHDEHLAVVRGLGEIYAGIVNTFFFFPRAGVSY